MSSSQTSICKRLEGLREDLFGSRGKSEMARKLGIRPSTYDRYERDRIPPADLLVTIAEVCDVTLDWLLTGEEPKRPQRVGDPELESLTHQFRDALIRHADFRPVASQFLHWLRSQAEGEQATAAIGGTLKSAIPILGALPDSSSNLASGSAEGLLARRARALETNSNAAFATATEPVGIDVLNDNTEDHLADDNIVRGSLLTHESGATPWGIESNELTSSHPDAVAWLIDDHSMEPLFHQGDYVVISPTHEAESGQPCVACMRQSRQLSCRVFHPDDNSVLLVPANSRIDATRIPANDLEAAYRVLAVVRAGTRSR